MLFSETQDLALTTTDLLTYDRRQLAQYLKRNGDDHGGFDISGLIGVESLSKSRRNELAGRLSAAAPQLGNTTASQPLKINELLTRLTSVADGQNSSQSPKCGLIQPPAESFKSTESTPPPMAIKPKDLEISSYHELVEDGGRPVCSIQDLSHLLATPTASYEAVLPWLSDHPDSVIGDGEIKTVFSRQFTRWWDFRKSQWDNRGISDSEEGFSTFLEASRSRWKRIGAHAMVSASSFEETIRRQWQQKPVSRQLPNGQGFRAYSEVVRRRLAPRNFTRPFQLKKDPRQQTKWTNWLEYLSYEQWWLEKLTAIVEPLEEQYHQAWKRLLEAPWCPSREVTKSNSANAAVGSAASGFMQTQQRRPVQNIDLAKELEAIRAALDATKKMIDDFIRETASFRHAGTAAYYQRLRVKWIVEVAHSIETETSQSRRTAESNTKVTPKENMKRRHSDNEDLSPEPRPKRTRRRKASQNAVSDTPLGKPQARRSSKRLVNLKDKVPLQTGV